MRNHEKERAECCEVTELHPSMLQKVHLPDEDDMAELAELYKVFGDSSRVRILCTLSQQELCVCDLAELLRLSQSAVSHQLRILKQAKLVKNRRDGRQIIYSLADEHVRGIIAMGMEHILEP